ncbi:cytochrome P450 [Rhizodiscina lignyota]|uniref:Cytochrome P450 n=1 Tax=Rhizodiscina lignyota TaxID=1504668 RepID=A0A9P4ICT4_9PEZI|nr:cytochrome P450 [Rhizodiscina lignyota]
MGTFSVPPPVQVLLAMSLVLIACCIEKLMRQRRSMRGLPGPPHHWLFGHILVAGKMARDLPPDVHPHHYWQYLRKTYELGDIFYFDAWPLAPPTVIICEADMAEQITVKHSLDKHPIVKSYLKQHLGPENMAAANGAAWKKARTVYNPGFAPTHLMNVISKIVQDVEVFHEVLSELSETGEVFSMESTAMKISFDVIGRLVLDMNLNSQRGSDELVDAFRKQLHFLDSSTAWSSPFTGYNPFTQFAIWRNSRVIDKYVGRILDQRFSSSATANGKSKSELSIMDVALDTYNAEQGVNTAPGSHRRMDATFRQSAIDQIRTFVFAGHDTISTTISMIFYFLSKNPDARSKAGAELDSIFGPGMPAAAAQIRKDPHVLNRLPYCHAVIKETLRLFPPANTVRCGDGYHITDPTTGARYPTHDWIVWPDAFVIARNEKYYPQANRFIPERFLPESPFPPIPVGAWRPFERGPRNCIGGEFGTLELKVVMALTLRDFDFVPAYAKDAPTVDGEVCYQMLFGSAKPKSGVPGRVVCRLKTEEP